MADCEDDEFEIRCVKYGEPEFPLAAGVRRRVFIEEQNVPEEEEWDDDDLRADHLLAIRDGRAVGTLRFLPHEGWLRVSRVAVLAECRGLDVGRRLMLACLREALERGYSRSFLHSQTDKAAFYRKFGYREVGEEFMEAGIPHVRMDLYF